MDKKKISGFVVRFGNYSTGEPGQLFLAFEKPRRYIDGNNKYWYLYPDDKMIQLPKEWFPELSFDDEPINVELTIKEIP